jgi:asparagine synthase (glutamine-hydrolysing)
MCGFAGLATTRGLRHEELITAVERMNRPIAHRGPDDSGHWADAENGIAFGFRRLAIIDLSAHGHQPMTSRSGRFVMVFNGEIYNHEDLRPELVRRGATFRGHSDTEVALEAFEQWGIEASLRRFIGMFAMAIWDSQSRSLILARDRLGKKPLFIFAQPGVIAFGSELKALHASPAFDSSLDHDALAAYLRYLYVPGPRSIFERVRKLEPGHMLAVQAPFYPLPPATSFWSLDDVVRRECSEPHVCSDEEAVDMLETLLRDAVGRRMSADVPLGAFLSGGIDSSTIAALMQAQSSRPIKTFSVGFDVAEHDEARHAAAVAQHLCTAHTEIRLTGRDALDVVPRLATIYDEPFADASQIPTLLLCRESRREVTVR